MPRRPKTVAALPDLIERLGRPSSERVARTAADAPATAERQHAGWRWLCGCTAFARDGDSYLWVPCAVHESSRPRESSEPKTE